LKSIFLLHPFSAKAIGLSEKDLLFSHSKPHERALLKLKAEGYAVAIDYFTGTFLPFTKYIYGIKKRFWPITKPLLKQRHGWRMQHSFFHYAMFSKNPPDLTIINMSGHGSAYCFKLAEMLLKKEKPYIAMMGGVHISEHAAASAYFKGAHHIIVHTEIQKRELRHSEVFKNLDIEIMPLGIDTTLFKPTKKRSENYELLFVGRISRLKQIELCLETVAHLKKNQIVAINLSIVGPASDTTYLIELKALTKKLNIETNVGFVGSVNQSELVPYYQRAQLLLLPSAHESFGMVMVEAMACGTPVAALRGAGGPDEIVVNDENGILATKEDFSEKVLNYLKSETQQAKFRKQARLDVESKWSLRQTEDALKYSVNKVFG
jgi:glycosyltransferase involved in cell wall biosynthesis